MDLESEDKQKKRFKRFINYANIDLIILGLVIVIGLSLIISGVFVGGNSKKIQELEAKLERNILLNKFARSPLVERNKLQEWLVIRLQEELKEGWDKENFSSLDMKNSLIEYLSEQTSFNKTQSFEKQSIIFSRYNKIQLINFLKSDPWIVIKKNHNLAQNENLDDVLTFYLNQDDDYYEFCSLEKVIEFLEKKDSYFFAI